MIAYLWVALGSGLGGMARYGFGLMASRLWGDAFPWGTVAINVLGSFVIGCFAALTVADGALPASANLRTFVMVGLCGGFTTFSSFSLQTLSLARDGNWFGAMGNVVLSVVLCLLAVTAGHLTAERIGPRVSQAATPAHTILAVLDQLDTAPAVLAAARLAASPLAAGPPRIEALHIRHRATQGFMPTEDVMTEARRQEIDGQAAILSARLRALTDATTVGATVTWHERTGDAARIIAEHASAADLVVMGRPASGRGAMHQALHAALFDAGCLTLLVPHSITPDMGRHVAIAWKPGEAAENAVRAALPWLKKAQIVSVLIGAEVAGRTAETTNLRRLLNGIQIDVRPFEPHGRAIGVALCQEAHRAGADLLLMGAYSRNRLVEMVLGGATRDIVAEADLPVLLHV